MLEALKIAIENALNLIAHYKPKRSSERQPVDGLPALMMADQKGKEYEKRI